MVARVILNQEVWVERAASGNAVAMATGGTGTIVARGTPSGCGQAVTSGPNTFAAASTTGPADIQIQWGLPPVGNAPVSSAPVNACPGTLLTFKWPSPASPVDTRSYGVVQIPSASCSAITAPTAVRLYQGNISSCCARVTLLDNFLCSRRGWYWLYIFSVIYSLYSGCMVVYILCIL